ncbi:MAG: peptidylprolyl isomerase [Thermoleophilia bacterium]|nr:peptidylprolyl isomerase [Thermoleophilia bacterium]
MAQVKDGDTVKVHYTGKLKDGTVFDSSRQRDPLVFTIGAGKVIPGFEQAVLGLEPGQEVTAEIPSGKAYGERSEERVVSVSRDQLPADYTPEVGHRLESRQEDGRTITAVISEISATAVTLDMNHPLAGEDLVFDIELMEIA